MKIKGIDVSHWQKAIDFEKVKKSGVDFVIIKAGGSDAGYYKDRFFEKNYKLAKAAGLFVGAYFFAGKNFKTSLDGTADAHYFHNIIQGKQFEMPVYIDVEATAKADKKGATDATIAFCAQMEKFGFYVGVYASDISGFAERLEINRLLDYDKWVARYGTPPTYVKYFGMWQYSSTGRITGIVGNVDLDYCYKCYPEIMKNKRLNGY